MTILGEVAIKVKRAILLTETFTVSQIADVTGVKYESVETVIQRLQRDGFLIKADNTFSKDSTVSKRGRPRQYYTFADSTKVKVIRDTIDVFFTERSFVEPSKAKPQNPHFVEAISLINSLEKSGNEIAPELQKDIESELALSREYEEMIEEGNEIAVAFNDFAQARLEYLKGEKDDAEELLRKAKSVFQKYKISEENLIDEYLISSKLKRASFNAKKAIENETYEDLAKILNNLVEECPNISFSPSVTSLLKEFIALTSQISSKTANLLNNNRNLEGQLHNVLEENEHLKIHQVITNEINLDLARAVKSMASQQQDFSYPQKELPEATFFGNETRYPFSKKIVDISEAKRKKRVAC
jgi:Mn-dependent DtxR family transcriptional regulator